MRDPSGENASEVTLNFTDGQIENAKLERVKEEVSCEHGMGWANCITEKFGAL